MSFKLELILIQQCRLRSLHQAWIKHLIAWSFKLDKFCASLLCCLGRVQCTVQYFNSRLQIRQPCSVLSILAHFKDVGHVALYIVVSAVCYYCNSIRENGRHNRTPFISTIITLPLPHRWLAALPCAPALGGERCCTHVWSQRRTCVTRRKKCVSDVRGGSLPPTTLHLLKTFPRRRLGICHQRPWRPLAHHTMHFLMREMPV